MVAVALLGHGTLLEAANLYWDNTPGSTDWHAAANWSTVNTATTPDPAAPPGPGDNVIFGGDAATGAQPTLGSAVTVNNLSFPNNGLGGAAANYAIAGAPITLLSTTNHASTSAVTMAGVGGVRTNTILSNLVLGAAAGSTQYVRLANDDNRLELLGDISEANPGIALFLVRGGGGRQSILLSGNNTFTGGFGVDGGCPVVLGSASAIPPSGMVWLSGGSLRSSDAGTRVIGNPLEVSGSLGFGSASATEAGDLVFTNSGVLTGDLTVTQAGASLAVGAATVFEGALGETGGSRSFRLYGPNSYDFGSIFLLGANTFSGPTVLGGTTGGQSYLCPLVINGIRDVGAGASSLGAPTSVADGTIRMAPYNQNQTHHAAHIRYIGGGDTTDRVLDFGQTAAAGTNYAVLEASGGGALTFASDMTVRGSGGARQIYLDGTSTGVNTFAGAIPNPDAGGVTTVSKGGLGIWTLSAANTFTGTLSVTSGTLVLDYANNTVLGAAVPVTLAGSMIEFKGKTGAGNSTSQTIGGLTVASGSGVSTVRLDQNGGDGVALTTGVLTRNPVNTHAALLFDLAGSPGSSVTVGTTLTAPNAGIFLQDSAGWLDWAVNTGVDTAIAPLNATTDLPPTANSSAGDFRLAGSQTLSGSSMRVRTLRIEPASVGHSLTLSPSNATANFQVPSGGGLLFVGEHDFTINQTGTGAIADGTGTGNDVIIHHFGTGTLTLDVKLAGNSAASGDTGATIGLLGTGLIDWTARANGGGTVQIDGVTVRNSGAGGVLLDATTTGAGSGNIVLSGGGILELTDTDCTRNLGTGAGAVRWIGDGGFSAFGADREVRLNNGTAAVEWSETWDAANPFIPATNALILGSPHADSTIDLRNDLGFGHQQRVVTVHDGAATVDARLSGVLAGGYGGGLVKDGAGTLELAGANTYPGETWIRAGELRVTGATGTGRVTLFAGATLGGTGMIGGDAYVASGARHAPGSSAGIQTFDNDLAYAAGATVEWELMASTATNADNPNALFDSVVVGGDLDFAASSVALELVFNAAGSTVLWSDSFWSTSHAGTDGWLLYNVTGTTSGFENFLLADANWLDSDGNPLDVARGGAQFSLMLSGNDIYLEYAYSNTVVPEPGTLALLTSIGSLLLLRRRQRR